MNKKVTKKLPLLEGSEEDALNVLVSLTNASLKAGVIGSVSDSNNINAALSLFDRLIKRAKEQES